MSSKRNLDIDAAEELLDEVLQDDNPVQRARDLYSIAVNLMGSKDFGGAMNDERAPQTLGKIMTGLEQVLETSPELEDRQALRIKNEINQISARIGRATDADKRTKILHEKVRKTQGGFAA